MTPTIEKKLIYSVFVPGTPIAQPRPRKGKYGNFYNPDVVMPWRQIIQIFFLKERKAMIEGPIILTVNFFFQKIKGLHGKIVPHTGKPDTDNLIKPVKDALTEIGVWKDDSQVYSEKVEKFWTPDSSGMQIMIETFVERMMEEKKDAGVEETTRTYRCDFW
jgi:Holliday junction resolvase RusA-like endonuclease